MFELSIKSRFSAAHRLQDYPGSCAVVHGHNWDVEVFVRGEELDKTGILLDFREMKTAVGRALAELDHVDLNTVAAFRDRNPSSENIAEYLFEQMSRAVNRDNCRVHRVSVNETPEARATYWKSS